MDEDNVEHMEEYHNCGYDGVHESKEKAIILKCVGRGVKLPPLSQIYFPSSISKHHTKHTMDVRPSRHVLDLVAPALTTQEPDFSKEPVDKPQSSQNNQHSDIHSESSDCDVYMSDDDDDVDECDSHPAKTNCPVQNNFGALFLPSNVICKTECSSTGNRLILSETDAAKNERDDSVTSDDEVYSNPSFDDDSDSEDIIIGTNNLNQIVSSTVDKNSAGDTIDRGTEKNIYLDEDLNVANTESLGVSNSCQASVTKLQSLLSSDNNCQSETVCLKGKSSAVDRHSESSSSNGSGDPIAEMFSSDENVDDFVNPFETFKRGADMSLTITSSNEFPEMLEKQVQKPQQNKREAKKLPSDQLNFKSIAQLLLPNPPADVDGKDIETNKKDLKSQGSRVLVIENLPQNYEKKNLDSFLQAFGKVESVTLIPFYGKMTGRVKMVGDLEWAVECINESNAFGAGAEPLRCYVE